MTGVLIAGFCVVLLATIAQATTGFGFALVGVPLMTLAVDPRTAVIVITTVDLALVVLIAVRERRHIQWRSAAVVTATSVVGIPIGIYVLATFSEKVLTVLIAVVVLVFTVALARGFELPRGTATEASAGVTSGVLLAATGMNGPPLVAAFQAMKMSPRVFRATLQAVFAAQCAMALAGYAITDQFDTRSLTVAAVAVPALVIGWFVGDKIFHRLAGEQFRRLILAVMACSAVLAIITAL